MKQLLISGMNRLSGEVICSGSKNAALPILCAALLINDEVILHNCPHLSDITATLKILDLLGCKTSFEGSTIIINAKNIASTSLPADLTKPMRSSILFLGSLLGRTGKAAISYPGGCELGKRPIDLHLDAIRQMGGIIEEDDETIFCNLPKILPAIIRLSFPSVGATQNIILASVLSNETIVIKNAAAEPEIQDLAIFLNKAGARISGAGTREITIEGVKQLKCVEHTIIPDRIEAGTYLMSIAATGGELFLKKVNPHTLKSLLEILQQIGCVIKSEYNSIYLDAPKKLSSISTINSEVYPGFPTDLQPQLTALLLKAEGKSIINENIFSSRTSHVPELNKLGADIALNSPSQIEVNGVSSLLCANMHARDLRAGAALIIGALSAEGTSVISGVEYIERGYENISEKFSQIGADIALKT